MKKDRSDRRQRREQSIRNALALLDAKQQERGGGPGRDAFADLARSLGLGPRQCREHLELALVLKGIPELEEAVASGKVRIAAARALARVAEDRAVLCLPPDANAPLPVEKATAAWIDAAHAERLEELRFLVEEAVVRAREWPEPVHRFTFELSPEAMKALKRAEAMARKKRGGPISPEEFMELVARQSFGSRGG
jgi:hypothetical protein